MNGKRDRSVVTGWRLWLVTILVGATSPGAIWPQATEATHPIAASVLTQRNDNARSGTNLAEAALNTKTVDATAGLFGKLFSVAVDGNVNGQPLYAAGLSFESGVRGEVLRDVLYVATEKNDVYAIDANTGEQIWARHLGPPVPATDITAYARGQLQLGNSWDYKDLYPDIGITSTPVIDIHSGTIFVAAKTKEGKAANPKYHYRLHAMDLRSGDERQKPVDIQGSVPGSATDAKHHKIVFSPFRQLNRPGASAGGWNCLHRIWSPWGRRPIPRMGLRLQIVCDRPAPENLLHHSGSRWHASARRSAGDV